MSVAPDDPNFLQRLSGGLDRVTAPFGGAGNLGLALLANSGYSTTPRSFGQILGGSALQAQQIASAQQQQLAEKQMDEVRKRYMEAQIQQMQQPKDRAPPSSVAEYEYAKKNGFTGSFQDWVVAGGQSSRPSAVQEWDFFNQLPKEEQVRYLEMKRNPNMVVREVGGVPTVVDPTRARGISTTPLSSLPQEAAAAGTLAGAKASGELTGKTTTEAKFDLPRVEANAQQTIDILEKIKQHPGLDYGVGLWSKAPVIPGTPQADFVALTEQLRGKQFLEAYQTLKGGGQITEVEGAKAENAIARMQRAQSKKAFVDAATEFQGIVRKGVERARQKAGAPATPASQNRKTVGGKQYVQIDGQWYEDDGT